MRKENMARKSSTGNPLARAASRVKRMFSRKHSSDSEQRSMSGRSDVETPIASHAEEPHLGAPRQPRREGDIGLDRLDQTYTPQQTSLKAGFRADGADRQRDQEFSGGFADDRWNDEDHYTNKSGDPRIGTHGRSYEAGERDTRSKD
jgi:hypothetical protein